MFLLPLNCISWNNVSIDFSIIISSKKLFLQIQLFIIDLVKVVFPKVSLQFWRNWGSLECLLNLLLDIAESDCKYPISFSEVYKMYLLLYWVTYSRSQKCWIYTDRCLFGFLFLLLPHLIGVTTAVLVRLAARVKTETKVNTGAVMRIWCQNNEKPSFWWIKETRHWWPQANM